MRKVLALTFVVSLAVFNAGAIAQTKVVIGYSGWTGFAPLTLARDAGIFKKNGLDVELKKIPQKDRHLAIASGDVRCAATTVETWIIWNANGVATQQIFQMDKSYGADGMHVRSNINTVDYPMVMDTFGCTPKFLADNPKAAQALANSYFEALEMIKSDPKKSYEIMGADVKQTGAEFEGSAKYLRWQDKAANQKFFAGELQQFSKEAAALLTELGIIKSTPDTATIIDTSYIK